LEQCIREANVDVVWFLGPGNPPVSVPYIATVWDLQHRLQPFFPEVSIAGWTWESRERRYQHSLPRATRVITSTKVGKEQIVKFYGVAPENVAVIPLPTPNGASSGERVSCTNICARFGLDREFIFYPAQFWPHKNHVNLLMALDILRRNDGLDLDLVLTGADKGNQKYISDLATKLGLTSHVHMLGFVTRDDLEALYRGAVALVYASYFGPDNLPPLEAFKLDCPVAAARVAGVEEQLEDAALLFDPSDPGAIATAVKTLYGDPKLRERLTKRGRELGAARTPTQYLEQICIILDEFEKVRRCWDKQYLYTSG
jgi:glycosyltransferase involved in cell wall biosynthesis